MTAKRLMLGALCAALSLITPAIAAPAALQLTQVSDLANQRVGATRGTRGDATISKVGNVPGLEVVRFDDESSNMTAFASRQVDIVVQEPSVIAQVAAKDPEKQIEAKFVLVEFPVDLGMRQGDDVLKQWTDAWVNANLGNGQLGDIYQRAHGLSLSESILAAGN